MFMNMRRSEEIMQNVEKQSPIGFTFYDAIYDMDLNWKI